MDFRDSKVSEDFLAIEVLRGQTETMDFQANLDYRALQVLLVLPAYLAKKVTRVNQL